MTVRKCENCGFDANVRGQCYLSAPNCGYVKSLRHEVIRLQAQLNITEPTLPFRIHELGVTVYQSDYIPGAGECGFVGYSHGEKGISLKDVPINQSVFLHEIIHATIRNLWGWNPHTTPWPISLDQEEELVQAIERTLINMGWSLYGEPSS